MTTKRAQLERLLERLPEEALYNAIQIVLETASPRGTRRTELPTPSEAREACPREDHL